MVNVLAFVVHVFTGASLQKCLEDQAKESVHPQPKRFASMQQCLSTTLYMNSEFLKDHEAKNVKEKSGMENPDTQTVPTPEDEAADQAMHPKIAQLADSETVSAEPSHGQEKGESAGEKGMEVDSMVAGGDDTSRSVDCNSKSPEVVAVGIPQQPQEVPKDAVVETQESDRKPALEQEANQSQEDMAEARSSEETVEPQANDQKGKTRCESPENVKPVAPKSQPKAAKRLRKKTTVLELEEKEENAKKGKKSKSKKSKNAGRSAKVKETEKSEPKKKSKKPATEEEEKTKDSEAGKLKKETKSRKKQKQSKDEENVSEPVSKKKKSTTSTAEVEEGGCKKNKGASPKRKNDGKKGNADEKKQKQSRKSSAYHCALRKARLDGKSEEDARKLAKEAWSVTC